MSLSLTEYFVSCTRALRSNLFLLGYFGIILFIFLTYPITTQKFGLNFFLCDCVITFDFLTRNEF